MRFGKRGLSFIIKFYIDNEVIIYMKLLAIDGNSILNRAFYGIRGLTNSKGFPTNAIFGFYNILDKMLKEIEPEYVVAAFDLKAPTFRHKKYDKYKATRHKMPDDLAMQLPEVKKMLSLLGICICEKEGFEADDILGTVSNLCKHKNIQCYIATGDRDSLQLIKNGVSVRLSTNKEAIYYDEQKILEEYGVSPKELLEVKALMGDASDNIPGVKGIGPKTAFSLISKYHSIDNIFNNISGLETTNRVKNLLSADDALELCRLSKELGEIYTNVPISNNISDYKRNSVNTEDFVEFLRHFELKKILDQFTKDNEIKLKPINSFSNKNIILNPDTNYVKKQIDDLSSLYFAFYDNLYIFSNKEVFEFDSNINDVFIEIISKSKKTKKTNDSKNIYRYCKQNNLEINNITFSCDIASYLIDVLEKDHGIQNICNKYFGYDSFPSCFIELCSLLEEKINQKNLNYIFNDIELPLSEVLADMELLGFAIDMNSLQEFGDFLSSKINTLRIEIFEYTGEEFNINSTKELGNILFEKLNLPKGKKTKTGYSTSSDVLEKLVKHHPIAQKLIEYRTLTKLMSTYVKGLMKVVEKDGRIHSCFKQTQTKTGRISSTEPNMQNIPIKTDIGSEMRKFFVAAPGKVLIDADYSQIELRILAEISNDNKMIEAFKNNQDIHNLTASEVFGVSPKDVSMELRRHAKIINFSVIYGVSAFSLSKDIGTSVAAAKKYIDSFFNGYSGVKQYMDNIVASAQETGYVKTMFGRLRDVPELKSKNKNIRAFGERIARNTPIQGTSADIIKIAMVNVSKRLKQENLNANLILQIHDELLIESSEKDAKLAAAILKEEMENAAPMSVPLVAEVYIGKTWYDAKN